MVASASMINKSYRADVQKNNQPARDTSRKTALQLKVAKYRGTGREIRKKCERIYLTTGDPPHNL